MLKPQTLILYKLKMCEYIFNQLIIFIGGHFEKKMAVLGLFGIF